MVRFFGAIRKIKSLFFRYSIVEICMLMNRKNIEKWVVVILLMVLTIPVHADGGDWRVYAAYHDASQVAALHGRVYVMSDGGLYSYDPEDTSVETYDKASSLSDVGIYAILPCVTTGELVVLYTNGNIDLLQASSLSEGTGEEAFNMPELKMKTLTDKTINNVALAGSTLYISTNSGIVCVDLQKKAFGNFYSFGQKIQRTVELNGSLYAITPAGTYQGRLTDNLLDPGKWTKLTASEVPDLSKSAQVTVASEVEQGGIKWKACGSEGLKGFGEGDSEKVGSIIPDSPLRNYAYKLYMEDGPRLLVAGGNFYYPEVEYTGTAMKYEGGKWTFFDEEEPLEKYGSYLYRNVTDIAQDPFDSEHHFLGTKRSGIYEFKDYKLVNHFTYDNSPLESILPDNPNAGAFVRVTGVNYDRLGNLWMCNNQADQVVRILQKDGTWVSMDIPEIKGYPTFDHIVFDQDDWAWITSRRFTSISTAGFLVVNTQGRLGVPSAYTHKYISSFSNQDGTHYTPMLFYCVREDLDGAIWLGCDRGLFVCYDKSQVFSDNFYLTQIKVPRQDGSNLADYLLSGVDVKCIAIDGGNRKWIGTSGSGVFLVSADGLETLEHFTSENSPLISDNINDIVINGQNGEVFIATDAGLVSYMGDATDPATSFDEDKVVVYPNPVRPDYVGNIHVTGLMYNSDVKIVNAAGYLVNRGTSVGGQYSWNGRLSSGKRCANGIYYVLATDEDGKKGVVAKFLMVTE